MFKPITLRLDKRQEEAAPKGEEEEEEVSDYGMEDFDLNNPFDEDFKPDAETPPPSPPLPPTPPPSYYTSSPPRSPSRSIPEEEGEQPGKSGKWGPPKEPGIKGSESVDLQTLSSMLTKNKDNPDYVVKSKKSKFYGYTLADIKKAREEILNRGKGNKQSVPPASVQEQEPDWEMEGSGSVDPNALVDRLHISVALINAGNTSLKLKKQVKQILGVLVRQNEITEKEAQKILSDII